MKRISSFALLIVAALSQAAKIEISFASAAEREVWILDEMPDKMPKAGRPFSTKTIPIEADGNSKVVIVHDPKTSSVAVRRVGDIAGTWVVSDKDWRAAEITVSAYESGKPLPSGTIAINTPTYTKSMAVENGKAIFFAVPYGEITVSVDYKGGGIPPATPQVFRIRKDSSQGERTVGVTVVGGTGSTKAEDPGPLPEMPSSPWYARLGIWIVALAIAAVGLIFVLRYLKERSDIVEEKLKAMGVPIPGDLATAQTDDQAAAQKPFEPTPVVPSGHCAYCGKELSECVCRLDAPRVSPTSHEPEFIGLGVELRIPEGESIVGREGQLVIQDATVSRQHAKVTRDGATVYVEDLASSNGTFVDGVRIDAPVEIKPGMTLHFGSVKVRLEG